MGKSWEVNEEFELNATPEQVWDAIATGPGIDSWYMGANEVVPGVGGSLNTDFGGFVMRSNITAWEPSKHLAYTGETGPDGRFIAFEYLIEARDGGTTVLRQVVNGFLPGDDWEAEFEAMTTGGSLYSSSLATYINNFSGRFAVPVSAMVQHPDFDAAWAAMLADLGVPDDAAVGDPVTLTPSGREPIAGVVDFVSDDNLGVTSDDGLYRFYRGFFGPGLGHHVFVDRSEGPALEADWHAWLERATA